MARYSTKLKPKTSKKQNLTPLWLALAGIGLVLITLWAFFGNNAQGQTNIQVSGAPRVKVEQDVIDRGNIKLGTPVRDVVRVTNVGDQPLRFVQAPYVEVKEGC